MKKYEDIIRNYVMKNTDVINSKAPSKKRLIKFSEAVSRAILEKRKSDTGYGDIAESLASAGLSDSGFQDYLNEKSEKESLESVALAEREKNLSESYDAFDESVRLDKLEKERLKAEEKEKLRLEKIEAEKLKAEKKEKEKLEKLEKERLEKEQKEKEKLEKEKLAAEKKEQEKLEKEAKERAKLKKTVLSFAEGNNITDSKVLYNYALSLGLPEEDALSVSESGANNVREKLRVRNIEKARELIISQRFTKSQAYAYAINLGLPETDALNLADFAYKMNQDTDFIINK